MSLIRRTILILLIALFGSHLAHAQKVNWRIAGSLFDETVINLAKQVEELSGGEFTIDVTLRKEHQNPLGIFDMINEDKFEMGHAVSQWWFNKDISSPLFTSVPMGMIMPEKQAWFYHGGGIELMHKVFKKHGFLAYPGGSTGTEMGGWFNREVTSVNDFKTMRLCIPGLAGEVYSDLGADVNLLPPNQLYDALRNEEIHGMEFIGPALDYDMKFHEVADYYYTGWHSPGTEFQFLVSEENFFLIYRKSFKQF